MNCIIVEDDEASKLTLTQVIKEVKQINLLHSFSNPVDALNALKTENIDLIFLDIEMPGFSGIELLKTAQRLPPVILTSAHTKYAVDAFDLNVVDYLVKPITLTRFVQAISKVKNNEDSNKLINVEKEFLFIKRNSVLEKVFIKDILWIEALGDYTKIHTKTERFVLHSTLKSLETKLPADKFVRAHRSFIIQIDSVNKVEDTTAFINNTSIPIGTLYKENFIRRLNILD